MRVRARKWGNSLAVRIPKAAAAEAGIVESDLLEIAVDRGRIVVLPLCRRVHRLEDLTRRIRRDNLHDAAEFGPPVGREVW